MDSVTTSGTNHHPLHHHDDSWYKVFVLMCCVLWSNIADEISSVQNELLEVMAKRSHAAVFFSNSGGFLLAMLPNRPYLFSLFLILLS